MGPIPDNIEITPGTGAQVSTDERGGAHVQRVTGTLEMLRLTATPTISTTAYAAKDAVGGLMTFANAARYVGGTGRLLAVQLVDQAQQRADLDLVLFDTSIAAPTDNAVFDPTDAELTYCVGWVPIGAGMYADFNDNSVAHIDLNMAYKLAAASTSMYGVLVARSTPTYVTAGDLTVYLTLAVD